MRNLHQLLYFERGKNVTSCTAKKERSYPFTVRVVFAQRFAFTEVDLAGGHPANEIGTALFDCGSLFSGKLRPAWKQTSGGRRHRGKSSAAGSHDS